MASNIQKFFVTCGRGSNDMNNKIRENVLAILRNPPTAYMNDPVHGDTWRIMSNKWNTFLSTLCDIKHDDINVKKMGGRRYNYDYEISFLNEGISVKTIKAEFKHNSRSLDNLPEYLNTPEKKRYIETCYAEYFYDNYIDSICALSDTLVKPSKDVYMKYVYGSSYSKNRFFEQLKEIEPVIRNEKKSIVQESIKKYLDTYATTLDLRVLTDDIKTSQSGKIFILWDLENFRSDSFVDNELEMDSILKVKNDNVIVVTSKHGTKHNLLLRWKNHLGILYPAWQISLQR